MSDPRALLEQAAQGRQTLQLRSKDGEWVSGRVLRIERAGIVVALETPSFSSGEDLRAWITLDGKSYTFSASVLRSGVPIPDRSGAGLLLGYLDEFQADTPAPASPRTKNSAQIEVLPAKGRGLRLLGSDVRIVDLSVTQLAFAVPQRIALKFVQGGKVRVRFTPEGEDPYLVDAEIRRLVAGEGHYLYGLHFDGVQDPQHHLQVISAFTG